MNRYDSITSLLWLFVGLGIILWSLMTLKIGTFRHPEGGFLPLFCGIVIFILAIIILFEAKGKKKEVGGESFLIKGSLINLLSVILILVVYAFLLDHLGFILTTFVVMLFIFKQITRTSWFTGILQSSIVTGACYFLFGFLLKIPFPKGWLGI
jgi:putative tricarboxylic transport membrane protein